MSRYGGTLCVLEASPAVTYHRFVGRCITLLTDFGGRDGYAAAMKGVILSEAPDAILVDAGHDIPPQDVRAAAWALFQYWSYYPVGTIHVAVVDPGVGTERAILLAEADGRLLLAPDNGLLAWIVEQAGAVAVQRLDSEVHRAGDVSNTFHGRDIFAYAAGRLAAGGDVKRSVHPIKSMVQPSWSRVVAREDRLEGEVIHVDHFGNLITNIAERHIQPEKRDACYVETRTATLRGISRTYGDKTAGESLALIGSSGYLEIAVAQGSAAGVLGLARGSKVVVVP